MNDIDALKSQTKPERQSPRMTETTTLTAEDAIKAKEGSIIKALESITPGVTSVKLLKPKIDFIIACLNQMVLAYRRTGNHTVEIAEKQEKILDLQKIQENLNQMPETDKIDSEILEEIKSILV